MLPRAGEAAIPITALRTDAARYGFWLGVLLIVGLGLVFLRQLLDFRDPFVPWQEDARLLLTGTRWGRTFLWAAAAAVVLPAAFAVARSGRTSGWVVATVAGSYAVAFPALTGHASGGEGGMGALLVTADVGHVWAAGAWLGGLAGVLFVSRPGGGSPGSVDPLPALVRAFSPVALVSVAVLIATGLFASWAHLPGPAALLTEPYGQHLMLKLVLVAIVLTVGWINWRRLTPRLTDPAGPASMRRAAVVEIVVGQAVLLVTALLVQTPPPG